MKAVVIGMKRREQITGTLREVEQVGWVLGAEDWMCRRLGMITQVSGLGNGKEVGNMGGEVV